MRAPCQLRRSRIGGWRSAREDRGTRHAARRSPPRQAVPLVDARAAATDAVRGTAARRDRRPARARVTSSTNARSRRVGPAGRMPVRAYSPTDRRHRRARRPSVRVRPARSRDHPAHRRDEVCHGDDRRRRPVCAARHARTTARRTPRRGSRPRRRAAIQLDGSGSRRRVRLPRPRARTRAAARSAQPRRTRRRRSRRTA